MVLITHLSTITADDKSNVLTCATFDCDFLRPTVNSNARNAFIYLTGIELENLPETIRKKINYA